MDILTYFTPWTIGGAMAGLVLSMAMITGLVLNRRHIGGAFRKAATYLFSQIGFFSVVIIIFMVISVLESGEFFNANITHGAILGLLGYALALGFDLVSVVCMLARLNAQRMRDEHGSRLNLVGVMICAAVSAFANAAGSLQGYNPADLNHTPLWMQVSAPWLGMVFPALIVVLSMTTDHILDHAPSRGIDVSTFRERERKRVDMLQVRLDTERDLLKLETELSLLRQKRELASGHVRREWVFWHWLRPVVPVPPTDGDHLKAEIEQIRQALRTALESHLEELRAALRTQDTQDKMWATEVGRQKESLGAQIDHFQERVGILDEGSATLREPGPGTQREQSIPPDQRVRMDQWAPLDRGRAPVSENQRLTTNGGKEGVNRENTSDLILATLLRLGVTTPDTRIAREVGCSRRTVARWKKRFQAQGLLSAPETDRGEKENDISFKKGIVA
ncbi:MAG TPA: helix-turn-helix domain-containing protein [Ktedonobacteraceae bacterium]|nr:helix-turn-helix domain-containing protein [Ktedonobacteraceae bacterium]